MDQFACISTDLTSSKINDHINFQWPEICKTRTGKESDYTT